MRLGIADNILWAIYLGLSVGLQWEWMFWAITKCVRCEEMFDYVPP